MLMVVVIAFVKRDDSIQHLLLKTGLKKPPQEHDRGPQYERLKTLYEIMPRIDSSIVFVGNSLTYNCNWAELFQNPRIRNRGIGDDCAEGVLLRIDEILTPPPKKIFFALGLSDLSRMFPPADIFRDYDIIINIARARAPGVTIYIQSATPMSKEMAPPTNQEIVQFNRDLLEFSQKKGCVYIDLFSLFVNSSGDLDTAFSNDGVHFNGPAYSRWKKAIEKFIE
jgi:lysophospholipase L1-like esterase